MNLPHLRWLLCALWMATALLAFSFSDVTSVRNWLYLTVTVAIPIMVMVAVWNDGPPPTVAELLRSTEDRW